jgi:nucleotide-binding universal stress UspA family protein
MIRMRTILVPTDFGPSAARAVEYAQLLAGRFDSRLHLLHVLAPAPIAVDPLGARGLSLGVAELLRDCEEQCRKQLDGVRIGPSLARRVTRTVLTGQPVATILDYVDANGIDIVVMGTHGRGPVQHVILGSVAERVVRHCRAPVLTVHAAARRGRGRVAGTLRAR